MAGLEVLDPVYFDFTIRAMTSAAQGDGSVDKTLTLMRAVRHEERLLGRKCDLKDRMEEVTGQFVM
jgi:uncharacterized membrane protein YebE (DUF533 family)